MQATAAVIRDQQQARQVNIDWDLAPNPAPLLRNPKRILIGTRVQLQPGRQQLLLGTSSKLDKSVLIGTCP
jgi:hypothetical protein